MLFIFLSLFYSLLSFIQLSFTAVLQVILTGILAIFEPCHLIQLLKFTYTSVENMITISKIFFYNIQPDILGTDNYKNPEKSKPKNYLQQKGII